tara:strand:+ start:730 stop:2376 length:1647 start_codon:yes stop_codon:yes gene_type:complete
MDGHDAVAAILRDEGVRYLFSFPHSPLIDACTKVGIRPIIGRTERTIINMADGVSRVSRGKEIGVVAVQYGPGSENAFGGIAQAFADSTPLIMLAGGYESQRMGISPMFDTVENYRGVTKWTAQIASVHSIPDRLRRAFAMCRNGKKGPIVLQLPMDIGSQNFTQSLEGYKQPQTHKSLGDLADIRIVCDLLQESRNPVIQAGMGILYGNATEELTNLAEITNTPVMVTLNGKGAIADSHPLALGLLGKVGSLPAAHFMAKADLVIGAGAGFSIANQQAEIPRSKRLVQLIDNDTDLYKDYGLEHAVIGDIKLVLRQITQELRSRNAPPKPDPTQEIKQLKTNWLNEWTPSLESKDQPINPYRVINELNYQISNTPSIVTHDSGNPRDQMAPFWHCEPHSYYIGWGKSTQLGYGLGLAYGAKLADPDKLVLNVMGDTAVGMAGMDFETASRNNIAVLTVILNNGAMGGYETHMPAAIEAYQAKYMAGDYAEVAKALGVEAKKVDVIDDLASTISWGVDVVNSGNPAVIEVATCERPIVSNYESLFVNP